MAANKTPTQLHLFIKPVEYYLINGPIPPSSLAYLDFVDSYLDMGIIDDLPDVHFMLESISLNGAPKWWKGTVTEFEAEFHEQYQWRVRDLNKNSDFVWMAAEAEVQAKRIAPLPDDPTKEQVRDHLAHGGKRLQQTFAVELLLDMWIEASESGKR